MDSPGAVGRRRGNTRSNAEDQALDQIAREVSAKFFFFFYLIRLNRCNYKKRATINENALQKCNVIFTHCARVYISFDRKELARV